MSQVLFVTSEVHPLIKTGGLADVSGSLPKALAELSQDVRIILPNYRAIKTDQEIRTISSLHIDNRDVNIQETKLPDSDVIVWLVDYPPFYAYPGNPYLDEKGNPWSDNAQRFTFFCRIAVEVAMNRAHLNWRPDLVHSNDWPSGLVPALLSLESDRPATIFTTHNQAYQGLYPSATFTALNLPKQLWNPGNLEYFGMMSFIKGGLACADRITTVSPNYAQEIQSSELGYGLQGLLSHRTNELSGILNGIDLDQWNPEDDAYIAKPYSARTLANKRLNKTALQQRVALPVDETTPIIGLIGRLVEQKGIDLVIECLPEVTNMPLQFILLGSGEKNFEKPLLNLAEQYPQKISITLGYDEQLAHMIEAGADIFLMPSRFEPCGLNQMYSLRYGTLPIVRNTGGLADTVIDALPSSIADKSATGIVFNEATAGSLLEAMKRALLLYEQTTIWKSMQRSAMKQDFSWRNSAQQYLSLYQSIIRN